MNQIDSSRYLVDTGGPATMAAARVHGFTMVELMITLAVGAILLALAIPSLSGYVRSVRAVSQTNDFVGVLNRARNEALVRIGNTTVCASNTGTTCAGTWADGWILFDDCDADQTPDLSTATCDTDGDGTADTNEALIRVGSALKSGDTINGSVSVIGYRGNGTLVSGAAQTFDVCVDGDDTDNQIQVNQVGRITTVAGGATTC